jgi:hypothetical protein
MFAVKSIKKMIGTERMNVLLVMHQTQIFLFFQHLKEILVKLTTMISSV